MGLESLTAESDGTGLHAETKGAVTGAVTTTNEAAETRVEEAAWASSGSSRGWGVEDSKKWDEGFGVQERTLAPGGPQMVRELATKAAQGPLGMSCMRREAAAVGLEDGLEDGLEAG